VSGIVGTEKHILSKKQWPKRKNHTPEKKNVTYKPLVDPKKVYLPPLHIKLGLMKYFVKVMDRDGQVFLYLRRKFPRISDAKIKEDIYWTTNQGANERLRL
jgi:hypothetical protein